MKKLLLIAFILAMAGCSSNSGWDCIQTAGTTVQREIAVTPFEKILVWERVKLFIAQGDEQKIVVESGENLIDDIKLTVTDGQLEIHNNNSCNLLRDYGLTKVYLTTPNITEIRSSTGLSIESVGTLRFRSLSLASEDREHEDQYHIDGDFILDLDVQTLKIVANGLSKFYLKGQAENASFGLYSGDCRIFAENLLVDDLYVFHRSTGNMIVNPQAAIRGKIVGLGDVISKNRPPIVEIEELYRGRLIFE